MEQIHREQASDNEQHDATRRMHMRIERPEDEQTHHVQKDGAAVFLD